ncbi:MAG: hypothetical protein PHQ43_02710 [Dehalococcoidales bacterium]|nr:hypothetical protein [Dehalococcoidales bacterium]
MKPKLAVCLPSRGLICSRTIEALWEALDGYNWQLYQTHDMGIPECMNHLVADALKDRKVSHILFIEEDMLIPEGGVKMMLAQDGDVVAIDYPYPNRKVQSDGSYKTECVSVTCYFEGQPQFTGLGCTLVKRAVFEALEAPWFETSPSWEKVVVTKNGKRELLWGRKDVPYKYGGHDINFCLKANWAGFSIKVVPELVAGHARIEELAKVRKEMNTGSAYTYRIFDKIDKVIDD